MSNIFDLFKQISSSSGTSTGAVEYLLVGLGNPGKEYERTRHNAGFMALDYIAGRCGARIDRAKFSALVGEADINGKRVLLMKPQTYMNSSGEAVSAAAKFYKIAPENIIVISDDVSLDVGRVRVRRKGSHGGQKGLKSIQECLGTEDYQRIKIGVGAKPHPDYDMAAWVLSTFDVKDMECISENYPRIYDGLCKMLEGNTEEAMQICNKASKS
ncbi:MAG: aminoacyl-tRNA hydrolase [Clostridia bacterium]|nr:aminoacyl-tRNA hydrolase [Clostridia bacterium]